MNKLKKLKKEKELLEYLSDEIKDFIFNFENDVNSKTDFEEKRYEVKLKELEGYKKEIKKLKKQIWWEEADWNELHLKSCPCFNKEVCLNDECEGCTLTDHLEDIDDE